MNDSSERKLLKQMLAQWLKINGENLAEFDTDPFVWYLVWYFIACQIGYYYYNWRKTGTWFQIDKFDLEFDKQSFEFEVVALRSEDVIFGRTWITRNTNSWSILSLGPRCGWPSQCFIAGRKAKGSNRSQDVEIGWDLKVTGQVLTEN
jgi:hypothetical protein